SAKLDGATVDTAAVMAAAGSGDLARARELAPYTLSDMADDALGVLDALGIERAHVLGASMGGMIAQQLAIERPGRLLSLVSMMSTTGEPGYGQPTPEAREARARVRPPPPGGARGAPPPAAEAARRLCPGLGRQGDDLAPPPLRR